MPIDELKHKKCTPIVVIGVHFFNRKNHLLEQGILHMLGEIYKVFFIGHRRVDDFYFVEKQLDNIVGELIRTKEYVEFYVGKNGDFDTMVASAIKRAQKRFGKENNSLILVLPYTVADMEYLEDFYDEIWIPNELHGVHFKNAITKRNEWGVDHADLLISYVLRDKGGAANCIRYAEKKGISIKNLQNKIVLSEEST